MVSLEEMQETGGDVFVNVEIRTQAGVEALDGTGSAMALLPQLLNLVDQLFGAIAHTALELMINPEKMARRFPV
jgi:hypothetical protein